MLALEAELSAATDQFGELQRNTAWHGAFNVRTALRTIARCMDETDPLRAELAKATEACEEAAHVVATLQAALQRGFAPLRRFSSEFLANRGALDDAISRHARAEKKVDQLQRKLKALHGDMARVEEELERYRTFDFHASVRRRIKLEDRVIWLRAELDRLQNRGLSLAPN